MISTKYVHLTFKSNTLDVQIFAINSKILDTHKPKVDKVPMNLFITSIPFDFFSHMYVSTNDFYFVFLLSFFLIFVNKSDHMKCRYVNAIGKVSKQ